MIRAFVDSSDQARYVIQICPEARFSTSPIALSQNGLLSFSLMRVTHVVYMTDREHILSILIPTPSRISLIAYSGAHIYRAKLTSQRHVSEKDGSPGNFTRRWSILITSDLRRPHRPLSCVVVILILFMPTAIQSLSNT